MIVKRGVDEEEVASSGSLIKLIQFLWPNWMFSIYMGSYTHAHFINGCSRATLS